MSRFLKKTCLFFIFTFSVYFVLGSFLEKIIWENVKHHQFQFQEDWHIHHADEHELLFIGNSRTWAQIDIEFLSKKLNKKSYCLAQDGRDSKILFYKFKKYLERNKKPRRLFLQFDPYLVCDCTDGTFYGKKNYLAYLYHDRLGINFLFQHEQGFDKMDVYFPLKRYFSTIGALPILYKHLTNTKPADFSSYKYGAIPQDRTWTPSSRWTKPERTHCPLNFHYLDSLVRLCAYKDIQLIFFYPPQSYPSYQQVDHALVKGLTEYAKRNQLRYWNYNGKKYNKIDLFYNHMHLNAKGSKLFTSELIRSIETLNRGVARDSLD